ncbi:MAG: acyltransferase family protein [Paludibacteraceae bacterium]|nr:acyltransferase family protein [Paludibacteraceae bacterium]
MISKNDANSMKGVAIFFIVFHNLLHITSRLGENEFTFYPGVTNKFLGSLFSFADNLGSYIFSFLGWYGVATFLFLSGFGLVKKYEQQASGKEHTFISFMGQHFIKLFTLLLLPYLGFIAINYITGHPIPYLTIGKHLLFIANFWPLQINPGVYWFFGLILQFYLCYYVFFYKKPTRNIIILNVISLGILLTLLLLPPTQGMPIMNWVRHQFIGWILPFTLGILYARYPITLVSKKTWVNLLVFTIGVVALIASETVAYVWLFNNVISLLLALTLNELLKKISLVNQAFVYLGNISAFLFVIHPVVRYVYFGLKLNNYMYEVVAYGIVSLILAIVYKWIYDKLFSTIKIDKLIK